MSSRLLPVVERAGRFALHRRGFESRTVVTPTASLHVYEARGSGTLPTTTVLHGMGSGATSFGTLLMRLQPHVRRLIAPDLPGHGFSGAPSGRLTPGALFESVHAALQHLDTEPMILVGNSLGGALALRYALERPARVRALVLVSPAGARVDQEDWETLLGAFRIDSVRQARRLLQRIYHRTPWYVSAFASGFRDVLQRQAIRDLLDSTTLEDLPAPEDLGALRMPVLLLWGQSERVMSPRSLAYFRRHLPPQTLVEQPTGFGHCPHFDDPARLAKRVLEFTRSAVGSELIAAAPGAGVVSGAR